MPEHFISRADAERDLLACAAYLAESIKSSDGHAEAMAAVVPRYLANGDVDMAAELANTVDDPFTRDRLLILVAEKCADGDDDEYAAQLVEAIEDFGLQAEGRERIGLIKAAKGQFEKARSVAAEMPHPEFVYAAVAAKQFADGDNEAFRTTLSEIEFPAARVSAYTSLAHSKLADGNADVSELLENAVADAAEIEHDEEKIRAFVEIGNLFLEAKQNGKAIETFDKARGFTEELDNIHRDAFFAAVSIGFLKAGSQDLADRTLDLVSDKTQMATALLGNARHYWTNDQREDALESLEESYAILKSQRDIETRNARDRYKLFTSIAAQFAGFERGERAIEIAERIEDETESMSALAQIAAILTTRKEDEEARHALNAISEDAQRVFALIGMSDAKNKNGDRETAVDSLNEAVHLAETVPQLSARSSAYNQIANRFADLSETEKAGDAVHLNLDTISQIRDESNKVTSLVELSRISERDGFVAVESEKENFLKGLLAKNR